MPRYEFLEGTSRKFWEITPAGKAFTTTYGRIGAAGQSTTKKFASVEVASREYDKLVAEKLRKGYKPAGGKQPARAATGDGAPWRAAYQVLPGARAARAKSVTTAAALARAAFELPCGMQISWKATGEGLIEELEGRFAPEFDVDHERAGSNMIVSCRGDAGECRSTIPAKKLHDAGTVVGTVAGLVDLVALGLVPLNDGDDGHVVLVPAGTKAKLAKLLGASFGAAFEEQVGVPAVATAAKARAAATPTGAPPRDGRVERELKAARTFDSKRISSELKSERRRLDKARRARDRDDVLLSIDAMTRPVRWRGQRTIANGDPTGWKDIFDAAWTTLGVFDRFGVRGLSPAGDVACDLLLVLGLTGWSKQLARVTQSMDAILAKTRGSDRNEAHVTYFASFCAELMRSGRAKPRGPKGALRRLSEHAVAKTLPLRLLLDACAFQLKNGGVTEADDVELCSYPLTPIWWFALAAARRARGLETPRPRHALFTTPFATLPDPSTYDPAANPLAPHLARL